MCGICGKLYFDGQRDVSPSVLADMTARIQHRGPDDDGFHLAPGIGLGMRRLSIIDLEHGQQPIYSDDGRYCIIYNGELYNFRDLRAELEAKGHAFRTSSDTEVVLRAFEAWGPACLRRFNGMFAFAIWDEKDRSLFVARDRIGEKPLYYYQDATQFAFASEIKSILADPAVPRALNPKGLVNFLAFGHAVAPDTIYRHIYKLLPGHYLHLQAGRLLTTTYWDVGMDPPSPNGTAHSSDGYAAQVRGLLDDSVRRRMVADVPVGAFLSGGVDSSAVVALMKRHATGPVKTFSVGFEIGGAYNELSDARQVAEHLGTEHHELLVAHLDLVDTLRTLVYHYDEPFGDAAGLPVYLLSRFARQHVKVALAGDGGDELFGGYRRYAADRAAALYQRLPAPMTDWLPALADRLPRLRRVKRALQALPISDPAQRYARWLVLFTPEMQHDLLAPALQQAAAGHDPTWPYPRYYHNFSGTAADHLNRLMYTDLKTWLVDVYMEKTDKASMANGLEMRLPLLDHRLVELAFQIPSTYKIRRGTQKHVLKHAVRDLLPHHVLHKPKHGFAVPTDPWFRGALKDFARDVLLDPRTVQRGYFDAAVVERMWREHLNGRQVWDSHLWFLMNFELWHRIYLDGEAV